MLYFNQFKNVLGYLSPLAFFPAFCYAVSLTTFVTLNDFLLKNCGGKNYFYHKCKNDNLEKLRPTPIPYFHPQFIGYQEAKKILFPPPPFKKRGSELWIYIMGSIPSLPPSLHLENCPEVYTDK